MHKRTPLIALFLGGVIAAITALVFQIPGRPFTQGQLILLYFLSFIVAMGVALLFDPASKAKREEFLKINFYEEEK